VSNESQNNEPTDDTLSSRSRVLHWSRQLILLKIENDNINEILIILIELCDNILGI
jgi:anti-sigma regulatory factor (Ser/Thr protein kinase)